MARQVTPPPVRRIVLDRDPTTVQAPSAPQAPTAPGAPPAPDGADGAQGGIGGAPLGSSAPTATHRAVKKPSKVTERMRTADFSVAYGDNIAVRQVNINIRKGEVLALIGPSGCGKTTLLRSLNRLVDMTP